MGPRLDLLGNVGRYMRIAKLGELMGLPFGKAAGQDFNATTGIPIDGTAGWAPGAVFHNTLAATPGTMLYVNVGTRASSTWRNLDNPAGVGALGVAGVAAGYKIARGQATTATASDTIVTGLATVVSAVANLESAPIDTCSLATAAVGNQSGAPAAGSILLKTWMPTTGGAAGNPTLIAATTFTKLANWIAIGT